MQIKMNHSRTATDKIPKIMDEEETDIIYIQEQYIGGNKIVGIPRSFTVLVPGGGNIRTAIVINNKQN